MVFHTTITPYKQEGELQEMALFTLQDITSHYGSLQQYRDIKNKLENSNHDLKNFAHTVSHDLQQPLNTVKAFGALLLEDFGSLLPDEGKNYIERMQHSSDRMTRLLTDILNFSKVDKQEGTVEKIDLNSLLQDIQDDLELMLKENHAELRVEALPSINSTLVHLRQLFQNLITNAIKFQSPDRHPKISITYTPKSEMRDGITVDGYLFYVLDNGMGFEKNQAERIFGVFKRLHSESQIPGTGLGLSICKKIVD